jgi:BirA family biotin operon repressor/biotin-[acetyl-CoA-carboxylase] ligase
LCRPEAVTAVELLSLRVALEVADQLEGFAPGLDLSLKWPNDLVLGGRKLGGILCEARWQNDLPAWVAVGIGLNVANPIPPELGDVAVALSAVARGITAEQLAEPVVAAIIRAARPSGALSPAELAAFSRRDWLLGRRLTEPVPGTADGLEPDGALRIRAADGSLTMVRSGAVTVKT